MAEYISAARAELDTARRDLVYRSPASRIATYRQGVDERRAALERAGERTLERLRERLTARKAILHAASPQAILDRGYALVTDADGKIVRRADVVKGGDKLTLRLSDGEVDVTAG
jgi:exodeoxyribonuclease VII large subunit